MGTCPVVAAAGALRAVMVMPASGVSAHAIATVSARVTIGVGAAFAADIFMISNVAANQTVTAFWSGIGTGDGDDATTPVRADATAGFQGTDARFAIPAAAAIVIVAAFGANPTAAG